MVAESRFYEPIAEFQGALCRRLGLDPNMIQALTLRFVSGEVPVVEIRRFFYDEKGRKAVSDMLDCYELSLKSKEVTDE